MRLIDMSLGIALMITTAMVSAAEGMVALKSPHGPKETMDRLEPAVKAKGLNVFARIDHAVGAKKVNLALPPTELLIFGNLQGGTPFMQCAQTVGIDLPLKVLVWQDADRQVWLGYNDPAYIAARHQATECDQVVQALNTALENFAREATSR